MMQLNIKNIILLILALILDAIDYVGGFIPGIGDFIDIIGPIILYFISKDPYMLMNRLKYLYAMLISRVLHTLLQNSLP